MTCVLFVEIKTIAVACGGEAEYLQELTDVRKRGFLLRPNEGTGGKQPAIGQLPASLWA